MVPALLHMLMKINKTIHQCIKIYQLVQTTCWHRCIDIDTILADNISFVSLLSVGTLKIFNMFDNDCRLFGRPDNSLWQTKYYSFQSSAIDMFVTTVQWKDSVGRQIHLSMLIYFFVCTYLLTSVFPLVSHIN